LTPLPLARWKPAQWAVGQIAVQIFRDTPSFLLLFYMTQVLAVPPAMAGAAIFIPKLFWAVLCDYSVGLLADRLRNRTGRRIFLAAGALLGPVAFVALFYPIEGASPAAHALHVALMLAIYMAVFALFSVPHLAIGTEMGKTEAERARVMGWRQAFSGVGLILSTSLAPVLVQQGGGGVAGYQLMAWVLAGAVAVSLVLAWAGSKEVPTDSGSSALPRSSREDWRAIWANKPFVVLYGAFLLQLTGAGIAYAVFAYLFTFYLAFPNPLAVLGIVGLIVSLVVVAAQPLWVWVAGRIGRKRLFLLATAGYALALGSFLLIPKGQIIPAYGAAILLGLMNSGCYLAAFSMLSDVIEHDRLQTGVARGGLYSALFIVNDKVAFALGGTLLAGLVLSAFGFVAGAAATQSDTALTGIAVAYAGVPALFNLAAFILMARGYKLEKL
jgi:glycoside/pentoside/hexuronide:cation symporter, GPH family